MTWLVFSLKGPDSGWVEVCSQHRQTGLPLLLQRRSTCAEALESLREYLCTKRRLNQTVVWLFGSLLGIVVTFPAIKSNLVFWNHDLGHRTKSWAAGKRRGFQLPQAATDPPLWLKKREQKKKTAKKKTKKKRVHGDCFSRLSFYPYWARGESFALMLQRASLLSASGSAWRQCFQ